MNSYGNAPVYNGLHRVTRSDVAFWDVEISDEDKQRLINVKILEMTKIPKGVLGFIPEENEYFARNFNLEAVTPYGVDYTGAMYFGAPGIPFEMSFGGSRNGPAILLRNGVVVNPVSSSSKIAGKGISKWELQDAEFAVAKNYETDTLLRIPRFTGRVHLPGGREVDATPGLDRIPTTPLEYPDSSPAPLVIDNRPPLQKLADDAIQANDSIQKELEVLKTELITLDEQFKQLQENKMVGNGVFLAEIQSLTNTVSSLQEASNQQTANAKAISDSEIQRLFIQLTAKQDLLAKCQSRAIGLANEANALLQAGNACDKDVERLQQEKARLDADLIIARDETKSITGALVGVVVVVLFVLTGAIIYWFTRSSVRRGPGKRAV